MKIKSGDNFIHQPTGKEFECVGTDDGKIWYVPDGEMESRYFDPADCSIGLPNVERSVANGLLNERDAGKTKQ